MTGLAGRRYWLVGASTGIGRQLALRLAREGAAVAASARDEAALLSLVEEMQPARTGRGGHAAVALDVTDSSATLRAFRDVGPVDGVIYCAGAYEPMSARRPDLHSLERIVDVNLTGALRVLAACVPEFCSRGAGHVLLVGSLAGCRGLPDAWGYGATKAALMHLAECLRCDAGGSGVKVQICSPGFVATRLTAKNRFRMPFIMTPEAAAGRIVRGMAQRRFEIAFPFVMAVAFRLLSALPRPLHFRLFARGAGHRRRIP
ncbi:MAG: SDR family NAD(P)-dependent oxidoreductase [Boseongicola sp. SB0675_bin_26]|nr:SDR family NAD(P)-dependent oxidoreductase [Boseongicola sp. SB0675_bin_26]